ncbi:multidrug effflux MFS transporter [Roseovarius nanhaiticus]|uniref:multidrug effflux MFS transporter n=1 Tax=Roseovarius nanhaiticus TaxID=573024 RepID=UPI002492C9B1|nr:multidrug effflux MFS transporter [Roseovarius nanhaiticus]
MQRPVTPLPLTEFVIMLAMMISIVALSTDMMLPGLATIGHDLGVDDLNDTQLIVSSLFLGFACGQALAGPLSDTFGRKPVIYLGYAIFILGCLLSLTATSWTAMIAGRVLQGLGAASPRIVSLALVRDGYGGRAMARIMSIVMAVFVLVPTIAPALGQGVIWLAGWRATFLVLIVMALLAGLWFALRQPETLPPHERRPFSARAIGRGLREILCNRTSMGATIALGFIFGAFLAYLSTAQQVYEGVYDAGSLFALYFGMAALSIGGAAVANSMLVMRLGMRFLTRYALIGLIALAALFAVPALAWGGVPPLALFIGWLIASFFCVGLLFGNLNALAMEPLGHMAGLGAALIGSVSNFIALPISYVIGHAFNGTVYPLLAGFAVVGALALAVFLWAERGTTPAPQTGA